MTETDEQLANLCKEGDDLAFQRLMNRYLNPIYGFIRQYIRGMEDVEDVVQNTFFKAWKNIKRFKADHPFKPWIYTIARNTALDHIKRKKAVTFSELDGEEDEVHFDETLSDTEPIADELFAQAEQRDKLNKVMEVLHPDHRAILIMHYHQEMTFEEISEAIGKPMNTVKSWHRRALIKIKGQLHQKP